MRRHCRGCDKALWAGFITEAIKEDEAGNFDKAVTLYTKGLECFQTHLKYDKNEMSRKAISDKVRNLKGQNL